MVLSQSGHMAGPFASVNPEWLALPEVEGGPMADLNPLPAGFGLNMEDTALLEATNAFMDGLVNAGELDAMFKEYITLENYNRPVD
jgi:ABC-type amino acid transport substrate-binding protein